MLKNISQQGSLWIGCTNIWTPPTLTSHYTHVLLCVGRDLRIIPANFIPKLLYFLFRIILFHKLHTVPVILDSLHTKLVDPNIFTKQLIVISPNSKLRLMKLTVWPFWFTWVIGQFTAVLLLLENYINFWFLSFIIIIIRWKIAHHLREVPLYFFIKV